jgi:transcriptional regulator with XRE-family HTH domain
MSRDRSYSSIPRSELANVRGTIHALVAEVRRQREKKGWSQEKLAEEAGISSNMLKAIEQHQRVPSLQSLVRIGNCLGLSFTFRS